MHLGTTYQNQVEQTAERRSTPRIYGSYPCHMRSVVKGVRYEEKTVLDNLSASGFYLLSKQPVEPGGKLFAVVHLIGARQPAGTGPSLALRGIVRRTDIHPNGTYGVAVAITCYRFL